MMGPPIGSYLYSFGGFAMPLVTFGTSLAVTAAASTFTIPSFSKGVALQSSKSVNIGVKEYMSVLRLRETMLAAACTALNVATDVFVLINLEDHLKAFDLTMVQVGFIYLCLFLSYGFSSPIAGKIGDKTDRELLLQGLGCIFISGQSLWFPQTDQLDKQGPSC